MTLRQAFEFIQARDGDYRHELGNGFFPARLLVMGDGESGGLWSAWTVAGLARLDGANGTVDFIEDADAGDPRIADAIADGLPFDRSARVRVCTYPLQWVPQVQWLDYEPAEGGTQ